MRSAHSLAVNNVESIGSLLRNINKYSDYVAIITINNLQDIIDNERDLGGGLEYIKRSNRSKTAKFGMTMHSIMYLRDRELQIRFSQFEAFYPGHVQCRITLAVRELVP